MKIYLKEGVNIKKIELGEVNSNYIVYIDDKSIEGILLTDKELIKTIIDTLDPNEILYMLSPKRYQELCKELNQ